MWAPNAGIQLDRLITSDYLFGIDPLSGTAMCLDKRIFGCPALVSSASGGGEGSCQMSISD